MAAVSWPRLRRGGSAAWSRHVEPRFFRAGQRLRPRPARKNGDSTYRRGLAWESSQADCLLWTVCSGGQGVEGLVDQGWHVGFGVGGCPGLEGGVQAAQGGGDQGAGSRVVWVVGNAQSGGDLRDEEVLPA